MKTIIIIPARYESSRLPGKPLKDISGKSLIQRTYLQAKKVKNCDKVIVATDDSRIFDHVLSFNGEVMMTDQNINSGSERCFQVFDHFKNEFDLLINIQGDEPFIQEEQIESLINSFHNQEVQIATLIKKIETEEDLLNPNFVKCVKSKTNKALYFSRSAIPFNRDQITFNQIDYFKHIGVYAFHKNIISKIRELEYHKLNLIENLEQLQWLENDLNIHTVETKFQSPAVDTEQDLLYINQFLKENPKMV